MKGTSLDRKSKTSFWVRMSITIMKETLNSSNHIATNGKTMAIWKVKASTALKAGEWLRKALSLSPG
jgi:hypothetical protein